jgi:hypothetical protein
MGFVYDGRILAGQFEAESINAPLTTITFLASITIEHFILVIRDWWWMKRERRRCYDYIHRYRKPFS